MSMSQSDIFIFNLKSKQKRNKKQLLIFIFLRHFCVWDFRPPKQIEEDGSKMSVIQNFVGQKQTSFFFLFFFEKKEKKFSNKLSHWVFWVAIQFLSQHVRCLCVLDKCMQYLQIPYISFRRFPFFWAGIWKPDGLHWICTIYSCLSWWIGSLVGKDDVSYSVLVTPSVL